VSAALAPVTSEARRYAIKELARRAGVPRSWFLAWEIDVGPDGTVVRLGAECPGILRFLHAPPAAPVEVPVARVPWPENSEPLEPDLLLPFCRDEQPQHPLYSVGPDRSVTCRLDLLASVVWTLSRAEERLSPARDEHGRFPAAASAASRYHFLERPILDEHGRAFAGLLAAVFGRRSAPTGLRLKLTHDVDEVGLPFRLRSTLAHGVKRARPSALFRDLAARASPLDPAELAAVRQLAGISAARGLHSAFYWKAAPPGPFDSGYPLRHPKVQRAVEALRDQGSELGVHPGYHTFRDRARLEEEVAELRRALGLAAPGGRQHYLRWSPDTWLDWEACGLGYDSSLGFAEALGFRSGTALPYRPWSLEENRELDLIELPLILMDCAAVKYMRLALAEGLARIRKVVERIARTGGVFTMLWHNAPLLDPAYHGWYEGVLDLVAGARPAELPRKAADLW